MGTKTDLRVDPETQRKMQEHGQSPVSPQVKEVLHVSLVMVAGFFFHRCSRLFFSPLQSRGEYVTNAVLMQSGNAKASELGAYKYLECSALTQEGLKQVHSLLVLSASDFSSVLDSQVFDDAIRCVLEGLIRPKTKPGYGCIMS